MKTKVDKSRAPDGGAGYFDPKFVERRQLLPGVEARLIWGERIMMGIIDIEPNGIVPWHSHMHEQCGRVLEGSAWFELEGHEKSKLLAGEHYVIPGHVPHRDHRKTLPLDDQGGIKGGLDRASHFETGNPLLRYATRPPFATQKGEVLRGALRIR